MTMAAGRWDDLVVVCGSSWWDGTPLLEQHMTQELSRFGPVLYVDPPTSVLTRFRSREAARASATGLRHVADNIAVLSPRVPPLMERPGIKATAVAATRRQLKVAIRQLGSNRVDTVVVTSFDPLLGFLGERCSVYYAKDDYLAAAELVGMGAGRIRRWVDRLTAAADVVVAVSPTLVDPLAARGVNAVLIPNGCEPGLFARTPAPGPRSAPVAAYLGHLSDRVDLGLLEAVADRGIRLKVIGPRQETLSGGRFDALLARPHVTWLDVVPYRELPDVLGDVTTCLLPYGDTSFNRASFPLKLLEYLAAGRRVVSTGLPAVRWLDTDLIDVADGAEEFAERTSLSLTTILAEDEIARRRAFAAGHTWESRAGALLDATGRTTRAELTA
jgi:teichuronic acid biosynthesis glycosyltransferase TuaH